MAHHLCPVCGESYRLNYGGQRTCSRKCGQHLRRGGPPAGRRKREPDACPVWIRDCTECGKVFVGRRSNAKTCSADCRTKRNRRVSLDWMNANYQQMRPRIVATAHARRARVAAQHVEDVDPQVVYERDGWCCGLCHKQVLRNPRYPRDPDMASLDHVVPIAEGGEHSYANTRCTHLRCNLARGARGGGEQLALL